MIARKKVSLSFSGEAITEEILEPISMTEDEYWAPLVKALTPGLMEYLEASEEAVQ